MTFQAAASASSPFGTFVRSSGSRIHVPFTGGGPAITSTLGGHTPAIMSALPTGLPYAKAGNLRALAMMSARRSSLLPDVPTMGEATGTELEADIVTGLVAPGGTREDHRATRIQGAPRYAGLASGRQRYLSICYLGTTAPFRLARSIACCMKPFSFISSMNLFA